MWILPKNYPLSSVFVADMVESKEDLISPALNIESSLMWRSKPSALKTWQRRWTKDSWMSHLFTRILKPSHQKSFETKLASSLEAIHVSRLVEPDIDEGQKIQDTYGPIFDNTSMQLDLFNVSLKMLKDTYRLDSPQLSATWKKMVTEQRGEYSQRRKLALLTEESEYTFWPTVTVNGNYNRKGASRYSGDGLATAIKIWPTPRAANPGSRPNGKGGKILNEEVMIAEGLRERGVKTWPTPTTQDTIEHPNAKLTESGRRLTKDGKDSHSLNLADKVALVEETWPTPTTSDAEGGHTKSIITEKGFKSYRKNSDQYFGAKLRDAVETVENLIPTPCSRDHKGGKSPEKTHSQIQEGYRAHLGAFDNYITYHNWLNEGESKGTLNPNWVEALMGLPQGWTSLKGDSNQWENGWQNGLWEKNIPRVAINIDDKVDRLRSLGNGVVPQTAAKAWIILNKKINL